MRRGLDRMRVQSTFFILFLFMGLSLSGQSLNQKPLEQIRQTRHQLGMNASQLILFLNEENNNLDLSYRLRLDSTFRIRFASTLELSTANDAISSWACRVGADRTFISSQNWDYYYGLDFQYFSTIARSSDRANTNMGAHILMGFLFRIGDYFSLSTEPTLALLRYSTRDDNSFSPNANRNWYEVKFLNVGQVNFNFHF